MKTIGAKMTILILIALAGLAAMGGIGWRVLGIANQSIRELHRDSLQALDRLKVVSDAYQIEIQSVIPKVLGGDIAPLLGRQIVDQQNQRAQEAWKEYLQTRATAEERGLRLALRANVQHVTAVSARMAELLASGDLGQVHDYNEEKLRPAIAPLAAQLGDLATIQLSEAGDEVRRADAAFTEHKRLLGMVGGATSILLLGWGLYARRAAKLSLARINSSLERLATSDADLSQRLRVDTGDETAKLAASFNQLMSRLEGLVKQAQRSGIQVTGCTTRLAASSKQLEATVAEQVASTNQVVANAKEISATSSELVGAMGEVAQKANQTAWTAGEGQQGLAEMETTIESMEGASTTISNKLATINEKAENISSIVTTIHKVADQTNLLSLNAAIEAEKAGEYGQGFSVVAKEIRRLADQTAVATLDIEKMVKDMKAAVGSGVMSADKFSEQVRAAVQTVRDVSGRFGEIIEQIQTLTPRFEAVSSSVGAQSEGAAQISEAMSQLGQAARQTADMLRDNNRAIDELSEAAGGLQREFSRFATGAV